MKKLVSIFALAAALGACETAATTSSESLTASAPAPAAAPAAWKAKRGPDGVHPDLNGVWQVLNTAVSNTTRNLALPLHASLASPAGTSSPFARADSRHVRSVTSVIPVSLANSTTVRLCGGFICAIAHCLRSGAYLTLFISPLSSPPALSSKMRRHLS